MTNHFCAKSDTVELAFFVVRITLKWFQENPFYRRDTKLVTVNPHTFHSAQTHTHMLNKYFVSSDPHPEVRNVEKILIFGIVFDICI